MLSNDELWLRIKQLEGKMVRTIVLRKENKVLEVTERELLIENRNTAPSREFITRVYRYLYRHGQVTGDNWEQICGNEFCGKVGRITLAILAEAVPDQIEAFVPSEKGKKSGIRKKQSNNA